MHQLSQTFIPAVLGLETGVPSCWDLEMCVNLLWVSSSPIPLLMMATWTVGLEEKSSKYLLPPSQIFFRHAQLYQSPRFRMLSEEY